MAALNSEKFKAFNGLEREACASAYSLDLHISRFHYYWIGIHKGTGKVQGTRETVSKSTVDITLQRAWMMLFHPPFAVAVRAAGYRKPRR